MVGIRFGGGRDELLTFMQCLGVITPPLNKDSVSLLRLQNYSWQVFLPNVTSHVHFFCILPP